MDIAQPSGNNVRRGQEGKVGGLKKTVDLPEASIIDILEVRELSSVLAAVIEYRPKHPGC